MSLEEEKRQVQHLRFVERLKLQEIANRLHKSLFWVNSRLDEKYEPKRQRTTSSDESLLPTESLPDDSALSLEVEKIQALRSEGLTYEQIAARLDRSIYWVHSRLRSQYRPRKVRNEKNFQEERVLPYLLSLGHILVAQYSRLESDSFPQEADLITTLEGRRWITEVKVSILHHEFHTAIGQLLIHRYACCKTDHPALQIALPEELHNPRLSSGLVSFLKQQLGIDVLFVPNPSNLPPERML